MTLPFSRFIFDCRRVALLVSALILVAAVNPVSAQYTTLAERQQALYNAALGLYPNSISKGNFADAEVFFMYSQSQSNPAYLAAGLTIVNNQIAGMQHPGNNAGLLQNAITGMDCYLRYGNLWDSATQASFKTLYTTGIPYSGESTSNLTLLAATERYLGGQVWGESAYSSSENYSTDDPTGASEVLSRVSSQVEEFASRPYEFYDVYELLMLAQFSSDPVVKNRAAITYEVFLAQAAGTYLDSAWAVQSGRSYPDIMNLDPWGGCDLLWYYFGGFKSSVSYDDEAMALAVANYQPPAAIVQAATDRSKPFTCQLAVNGGDSQYESTYMTANYAVFSDAVSPGTGIFGQIYPYGVMWNDTNTSHEILLWITDPSYDDPTDVAGFHTHGMTGRDVQWLQNKGTIVAIRSKPTGSTNDPYPYFLGYVPGGYQAMINDAANGRIYLYYNDDVMIAISSYQPFTWDPQGGIYAPSSTPYAGDSQFHLPATTYGSSDQACCALETANPTDYPGTTPAQRLAAFQAAIQKLPLPQLTGAGTANPTVSYTDHNGESIQKTLYEAAINTGNVTPFVETYQINGVPYDHTSWPEIYNPYIVMPYGGNAITEYGNQQTTYDLTNWTITTATVTAPPPTPTNFTVSRGTNMAGLSWTAAPTAMTYQIQRSTSPTGPFTTVQTNIVPTQVNDYGLSDNVTYYYQIAAVNSIGMSAYSTPVAVTPQQSGLMGTYFSNITETLPSAFIELDPQVDFYWTTLPGGLSQLSVKWTGWIVAPTTDTYTFYMYSEDSTRLTINGNVVVNFWGNHPQSQSSGGKVAMVAGQKYPIQIDYQNGAICELKWANSSGTIQLVPSSALIPSITTPPATLSAQANDNAVTLSWAASPIATDFNVKRSTTSGGGYVTLASPTSSPYVDNTAVNGTTYYYVVSALDGGGESSNSTQVSATPNPVIAAVPTGINATPGDGQVSLSWSSSPGATSYHVYRSTTTGTGYSLIGNSLATTYLDAAAIDGTTYYYVVTSVNSGGESAASAQVSATPEPLAPQQPTNLVATGGTAQVTLAWTAGTGAASYTILRSTTSDSNFAAIGTATSTSYTDTAVANGATYYYTLASINGGGQSNNSLQASATTASSAPTNLVAAAGISKVSLTWTAPLGAVSYVVERSTTNGGGYATLGTPTSTSYTDSTAVNGTTYYYVVAAVNSGGQSANSAQAVATPEPAIPSAPTNLLATAGNALVGLSWTASTGAVGYNIKRSTTSGGGYATVGSSTVVAYTDYTALNGTTYYYVVTAVNGGGESAASAQTSAKPQVSPSVLPSPWLDQDINTGLVGSAGYSGGIFTVTGSGAQIYGTSDGFHFVYRTLTGDGVVIARIKSGGGSSKSGLMIRQSLTANSNYVDAVMNGGPNAVKTEYRATPGAGATSATGTPANDVTETTFPYWLKLVRTGSQITAYRAPDGINWTQTGGSVTIPMTDPVYVGLVQTSDNNTTLATASFDNVTLLVSPTNLTGTALSTTQVQLNWTNNPGASVTDATGCLVQRSPTGANTWTTLTSALPASSTSYLDGTASAGTTYDYRVACFNAIGTSAYATLTTTTLAGTPGNLAAVPGNYQVGLTWTASTGAASYNVKRSTTSGGGYVTIASPTSAAYTDTTAINGTTYYYVVSAVNAGGESANSTEVGALPSSGNNDGIPDAWREQYFGTTTITPGVSGPLDSPSHDGVPNLVKYATGNSPLIANLSPVALLGNNGQSLTLGFTRLQPTTLTYQVEATNDLTNANGWTALAALAPGATTWTGSAAVSETGGGATRTVTVTDTAPISGAPRYLRLTVIPAGGGQSASTIPQGYFPTTLAAGTGTSRALTVVSMPLPGYHAAVGTLTAVTANTLTDGNAAWSAGQFSQAATPYYIHITSGAALGRTFLLSTGTANTATTVTLDPADAAQTNLTQLGLQTGSGGDSYEILPANTIGSVFGSPATTGILGGASATASDQVSLYFPATGWVAYYYNTTSGWLQSGSAVASAHVAIRPDAAVLYSRLGVGSLTLAFTGWVPAITRQAAVSNQGVTALANNWPANLTLAASNIRNLPGWVNGPGAGADTVSLYTSAMGWLQFYYNGAHWIRVGPPINSDNQPVPAGSGLLINKAGSTAGQAVLSQTLPYSLN